MSIFQLLSKYGPVYNRQTKQQQNIKELKCKYLGLLFTAQWCAGCVQLSKTLPGLLKKVDKTNQQLKILTIRMDNSSSKFGENYYYFPRMVYQQAQQVHKYFRIKSLPTMLVFNMLNGKMVSFNGVEDMQRFKEQTFRLWGSM